MYEKFAELLVKNHTTAYQVSKDTGIAQSTLSDWKTGRIKTIGALNLKKIADYFGVSVDFLLEGVTENDKTHA